MCDPEYIDNVTCCHHSISFRIWTRVGVNRMLLRNSHTRTPRVSTASPCYGEYIPFLSVCICLYHDALRFSGLAHMFSRPSPSGPVTNPGATCISCAPPSTKRHYRVHSPTAWERHVPRLAQTPAKAVPNPLKTSKARDPTKASKPTAQVSNAATTTATTTSKPSKGLAAINRCVQVRRFNKGGVALVTLVALTRSTHHTATEAEGKWSAGGVLITAVLQGG